MNVTEKTRKILINVGGFGLGILWVLRDELENPKIFRIPQAAQFSDAELVNWNQQTGPKGPWAVEAAEISRMNSQHFIKLKETETPSSTW